MSIFGKFRAQIGRTVATGAVSGGVSVPPVEPPDPPTPAPILYITGEGLELIYQAAAIEGNGTSFGNLVEGEAALTRTFTVTNNGNANLEISNLEVPLGFFVTEGLGATIAPSASDTFTVQLPTTDVGTFVGSVSFIHNDANFPSPFLFDICGHVEAATPPNALPSGTITSPTAGSTITAIPVMVTANLSDSDGTVIQARLMEDGGPIGTDIVSPWVWEWNPPNGVRTLTVEITDNDLAVAFTPAVAVTIAVPPPPPPPPPGVAPSIGSVTVNDYSTTAGTPITVSWTNSGDPATQTLVDVDGNGVVDYTLTSETSQIHAFMEPGTYRPTVTLTNATGSDVEIADASVVVTVGGVDSLITIVTVTENGTGGAKTNEIVEFGLPLHPTFLPSGQNIKVVDDDGAGGVGATLANFQWDNEAPDDAEAARFGKVTAIVPSLASGGTRKLRVYASADAPPSGSPITIANLQALGGYANGLCKFTATIAGVPYALSLKDLFDGGSTTFSKTGLNIAADLFRSGPVCTEWKVFAALRNGGSPHMAGNGLWAEFHVSAYKANPESVSVSNPITHIRIDVLRKNAAIDRAAVDVQHYYYDMALEYANTLSDPTLITTDYIDPLLGKQRYRYATTQPAATITLEAKHVGIFQRVVAFDTQTANFTVGQILTGGTSGVLGKITQIYDTGTSGILTLGETNEPFSPTVGETITDPLGGSAILRSNNNGWWPYQNSVVYGARYLTATRDSGTWPTDVLGSVITAGTGKAMVVDRLSATQVRLWIFSAFSAYAFTSGNWTLEGVSHYYNTRHWERVRIGTKPSNIALWGDHTVSAGSATNPKTRAAMDYLDSTHMTPPYAATFAQSARTVTALDVMKGDGAIKPGTVRGPAGGYPNAIGGIYQYIGGTGARDDIGTLPVWQVAGIIRPDANGLRGIFENAKHYLLYQHSMSDIHTNTPAQGQKGMWPRSDNGLAYRETTTVNFPVNWATAGAGSPGILDTDLAHQPAGPYIPYLMTGDLIYLAELQAYADHTEWASCSAYQGTNHQKTPFGHATAAMLGSQIFPVSQTRAAAWRFRDRVVAAAATPGANKPSLYHPKSYQRARVTMNLEAINSVRGINAPQYVGNDARWMQNQRFNTLDPALLINLDTCWQLTYVMQSMGFLEFVGMGNTLSDNFMIWLQSDILTYPNPDVVEDLWTKMYFHCYEKYPFTGLASSRAEQYRWSCHVGPANVSGWGFSRPFSGFVLSGTLTLSDRTVGTGRTFTFTTPYFAGGGTGPSGWYVGGYIRGSGGIAKITSVISSTVVECTIITEFSTTTPAISGVVIPGPHPTDYGGQGWALDGSSTTQIQDMVNAMRLLPRYGYDRSALIATQISRPNYSEGRLNFYLKPRS